MTIILIISFSVMASDGQYFLENWSKERQNQVSVHLLNGNLKNSDARLLWEEFNAKEHFSQVHSHKNFVLLAFKRFGTEFFPNLTEESLMKHDDSKLNSFIEVVGYTDRWVWMREDSKVWSQGELKICQVILLVNSKALKVVSEDGSSVKTFSGLCFNIVLY